MSGLLTLLLFIGELVWTRKL